VRQVLALIQEPEADQESDDGADGTD
jgi:hypothetical protein